jgi:hypothetical protein
MEKKVYESVNELSDGIVICRCLAKIRNFSLPKKDENIAASLGRIRLAEYYLELLKKNGKLRSGVKEEELKFRLKDLENAQKAAFSL